MSPILPPRDLAAASLFAGYLQSLQRDPRGWEWPASTAHYLQHRIETLAAELVRDGANVAVTA